MQEKLTQSEIDDLREMGQLPEGFVEAESVLPAPDPDITDAEELAASIAPTSFQWDERAGGNLLSDLKKNFSPETWEEFANTEHTWDAEGDYGKGDAQIVIGDLEHTAPVTPVFDDDEDEEDVDLPEGTVPPPIPERKPPQNRTEELWIQEDVDHARTLAPEFEMNYGRFDPFAKEVLGPMIDMRSFSALIQRNIHHLDDAIAHAMYLCKYWAKEDAEAAKDDAADPTPPTTKKEEKVENARIAWKTAVSQRKDALAQWDAYVGHLRRRFQRIRDRR